jgi:DNA-damage-inducible protein J
MFIFVRFSMAANALVTTRINESIKQEAADVLATMGLTVSDAVRLMLTKIAKEKSLPFELWQPNAETIAAMQEARSSKLESFDSIDGLMASLNAKN